MNGWHVLDMQIFRLSPSKESDFIVMERELESIRLILQHDGGEYETEPVCLTPDQAEALCDTLGCMAADARRFAKAQEQG